MNFHVKEETIKGGFPTLHFFKTVRRPLKYDGHSAVLRISHRLPCNYASYARANFSMHTGVRAPMADSEIKRVIRSVLLGIL